MVTAARNRAIAWFGRLSLRGALAIGFGALIALTLIVVVVSLVSQKHLVEDLNKLIEVDGVVANLSVRSNVSVLKARRAEQDFVLSQRGMNFEQASARFVPVFRASLAEVRENMARIRLRVRDPELVNQSKLIEQAVSRYEAGFLSTVVLHGQLGRVTTGLEGQFRDRAHDIEAIVRADRQDRLMVGLLSLRRHEKDFILRGTGNYAVTFGEAIDQYRADLALARLPPALTGRLLELTNEYRRHFEEYVQVSDRAGAETRDYLAAVRTVEPLLENLYSSAIRGEAATRNEAERHAQITTWTIAGAGLVATILGLLVAWLVSRSITSAEEKLRENEIGVRRVNRILAVMSGINALVVRVRNRGELFSEACRIVVEAGRFTVAWIGIVDRTANVLVPVAWAGPGREHADKLRLKLGDAATDATSLAAEAVREKRAVVSNDVTNDPRVILTAVLTAHGLGSAVVLPLIVHGEVLGTLTLVAKERGFFDEEEMKLLADLATDIGFALDHIEKEEKVTRLTRVYAVLSGINSLIVRVRDRDELFKEACRIAVEEGRFKLAWIGVVDWSAMKIEPVASAGSKPEYLEFIKAQFSAEELSTGNTLPARAIRAKTGLFSNDIQNDPRIKFKPEHIESGTRSLAVLPLLISGEVAGVLCLYAEETDFFDAEEEKLLTELSGDIAFALEHIEKAEKLDRMTRVNAILSGINGAIVRIHARQELFVEACRIAVEIGGLPFAWLAIVDEAEMRVRPVASAGAADVGFLEKIGGRFSLRDDAPEGHGFTAKSVREKRPLVANDIENHPDLRHKQAYADRGIKSIAAFPMLISGKASGVFILHASEVGFFDDEEVRLLFEVASNIAFALDHIEKAEKLDYLAYYDPLTGLANRTLFLERIAQFMRSAAGKGHKLALFLFDLERFKNINDSLGRPAGDALLILVAEWLTRNLGDANLFARVGADHFAIVLPEVTQDGDLARLLEKTMAAFLEHPFRLNDAVFRIAAKVGVALFPDDGADAGTLFKNAEAALKKAKASGDRYLFHTQKMTDTVAGKLTLENQLRQALEKEEFVLHYQPKVNLGSGMLTSAEALIRWNDPRTGLVPPGRFIPVLEETGLINDVGRWALRKAVEDYLRWRNAGLAAVRIAVNVSPLQLRNRGFIAEIRQAIGIDARAAAGLELEITESLIMADVKHSIASLQAIRSMGVTIAIDDFGTGFSSLSYLAKLPVDSLKIDRSFVIDMTSGPQGLALVSTIITLAHSLKLKVVAEGVETDEQSRLLRLLGCDEMQGFLFSKPVPGELFESKFLSLLPPRAGPDREGSPIELTFPMTGLPYRG